MIRIYSIQEVWVEGKKGAQIGNKVKEQKIHWFIWLVNTLFIFTWVISILPNLNCKWAFHSAGETGNEERKEERKEHDTVTVIEKSMENQLGYGDKYIPLRAIGCLLVKYISDINAPANFSISLNSPLHFVHNTPHFTEGV